MIFKNKVVIVTGSSSGIGASIAILFAKEGADIAIVGRNEAKLKKTEEQMLKFGKKPLVIKADISKDEETRTIVKKTVDKFGKLDVLVNSAGMVMFASIFDVNLINVYDHVMNTNLRSIVLLTNLAAPHLVKTKGNIVNISSVAGTSTLASFGAGHASYCASKAGVDHFSRVSALELATKGVRVNTVSPGPVQSDFVENAGIEADWEGARLKTALKTLTQPEEVANSVLYLASDKAKSITGGNYVIDSGAKLL